MSIIEATYVTEWDNGTVVSTACSYDTVSGQPVEIEVADVDVDGTCEREYVLLADGTQITIEGED